MGGSKTTVVDTTPKQTTDMRNAVQGFIMDPKKGGIAGQGTAVAPTMPGNVQVAGAQPVSTMFNSGAAIDRGMSRDVTAGPGVSTAPVTAQNINTSFNSGTDINRGDVRNIAGQNVNAQNVTAGPGVAAQNVNAQNVNSTGTTSVDQLGGANSAFFQNMMGQLQPSFTQARNQDLTAAKEAAGSLTGSGFANRLGSSVNRSLGNEQATLANYASQGLNTEVGRQQSDAARSLQAAGMNQSTGLQAGMANQSAGLQAGIANQNVGMQAQLANQSAGLQAGIANQNVGMQSQLANQSADQNFMNAQLTRNAQGLTAQQMGMQAGIANQGANLQAGLANQSTGLQAGIANQNMGMQAQIANQGADQNFINSMLAQNAQGMQAQQMGSQAQQFNSTQQQQQNALQAQLDAQRNALGYQGQLGTNQQNANNFMQLTGQQAGLGVGPTTVQQSQGFGGFLGGLGGTILGAAAGPIGSTIGNKVGSQLFGG